MEKRYTKEQRYRNNHFRRKEQTIKKSQTTFKHRPPEPPFKLSWIPRIILMIITAGIISGN
jgi:hypothetical protein